MTNSLALLRLFMVNPIKGAIIHMKWDGQTHVAESARDGFFKFEWQPATGLQPGTYPIEVALIHKKSGHISAHAKAEITVPTINQFAFISDIDDTFLISHSSNLRRRLYVLLTENARSRKPFDGVVKHYRLLKEASTGDDTTNMFFYVSSSEWNLYDYIREFSRQHKLPDGVYLLNQVKQLSQVFKTGQNNHSGKFTRIVRIIEAYPGQRFILLGDDSQQDPYIYASIVSHFPGSVACVYIRAVHKKNQPAVRDKLKEIETAGVPCCYFDHSEDAIHHSKKLGIISSTELPV